MKVINDVISKFRKVLDEYKYKVIKYIVYAALLILYLSLLKYIGDLNDLGFGFLFLLFIIPLNQYVFHGTDKLKLYFIKAFVVTAVLMSLFALIMLMGYNH